MPKINYIVAPAQGKIMGSDVDLLLFVLEPDQMFWKVLKSKSITERERVKGQ
jgi:hypothetical protein